MSKKSTDPGGWYPYDDPQPEHPDPKPKHPFGGPTLTNAWVTPRTFSPSTSSHDATTRVECVDGWINHAMRILNPTDRSNKIKRAANFMIGTLSDVLRNNGYPEDPEVYKALLVGLQVSANNFSDAIEGGARRRRSEQKKKSSGDGAAWHATAATVRTEGGEVRKVWSRRCSSGKTEHAVKRIVRGKAKFELLKKKARGGGEGEGKVGESCTYNANCGKDLECVTEYAGEYPLGTYVCGYP